MNEQQTVSTENTSERKPRFESLRLRPEVLRALREAKYDTMFPIQEQGIPPLLEGKDIIGQAHTGSGKTAAFSIPIIEKINASKPYVQALVVVPTRELALQVTDEFNKLAKFTGLKAYSIYGGQSITPQIERLTKRTPQVVVATPGRLIDHIERETIDLQDVQIVILDEADRMLDMGFIDDVDYILRQVPSRNQIALFSATMPDEIRRLSSRYMNRPVEVLIDSDEISLDSIEQRYTLVDERNKFNSLVEYLKRNGISSGIIFCGMKFRTQRLAEKLQAAGFKAAPIHGDLSQNQREHAMRNFRSGHIELLVATDVAARGIDVPEVSHVINYDVPQDPLTYFHRIGRTARAGRAGKAITFVTESEYPDFNRIAGMTEVPITKMTGLLGEGAQEPRFSTQPIGRDSDHGSHSRRGQGGRSRDANWRSRGNPRSRFDRNQHRGGSGRSHEGSRSNFSFTENVSHGERRERR